MCLEWTFSSIQRCDCLLRGCVFFLDRNYPLVHESSVCRFYSVSCSKYYFSHNISLNEGIFSSNEDEVLQMVCGEGQSTSIEGTDASLHASHL